MAEPAVPPQEEFDYEEEIVLDFLDEVQSELIDLHSCTVIHTFIIESV